MTADAARAELDELRTVVVRAREQAMQITLAAQRARAGLREEAERIRAQREAAERELRDDVRRGEVDPEHRALAERLVDGETTWREVLAGEDGAGVRATVGDRVRDLVEELRAADPAFRDRLDEARRQAEEMREHL